jgi:isocitrate dehydrogenase
MISSERKSRSTLTRKTIQYAQKGGAFQIPIVTKRNNMRDHERTFSFAVQQGYAPKSQLRILVHPKKYHMVTAETLDAFLSLSI